MANWYLRSTDGNDINAGTPAAPKATLAGVVSAMADGDRVFASSLHAENTAAAVVYAKGTPSAPCLLIGIADWGAATDPELIDHTPSFGATIQTEGSTVYLITFRQYWYITKILLRAAYSLVLVDSGNGYVTWEDCTLSFERGASYNTVKCGVGSHEDAQTAKFVNCIFVTTGTGALNFAPILCSLFVEGCDCSGITVTPTTFLTHSVNSGGGGTVRFSGLDLSMHAFSIAVVDIDLAEKQHSSFVFENCRLSAGQTLVYGTPAGPGSLEAYFINCDSSDTNYRYYHGSYEGVITHETINVRNNGATDGTTPISRKMVSSPHTSFPTPLELECNVQWNNRTNEELTATAYIMTSGTALKNNECWMHVEYLGSGTYPISSVVHNRALTIMQSGVDQTSSSVIWNETGIDGVIKQELSTVFTPQMAGPIKTKIMLAKPSTTIYVCPKVEMV